MKFTEALHEPLLAHMQKWESCRECSLCDYRSNVVFYSGTLPANVMFIGKAPSQEADHYGEPYPAKADYFHQLAESAGKRWCVTYLVSCGPSEIKLDKAQFQPCWSKVCELAALAKPKILVIMGKDPFGFVINNQNALVKAIGHRPSMINIVDPFWITTQKEPLLHLNNAKRTIEQAVTKYITPPVPKV